MTIVTQRGASVIFEPLLAAESWGTAVRLTNQGVWHLDGDHRGCALVCEKGSLWVTEELGGLDHELREGEMFVITRSGRLVAQATEDSMFRLTSLLSRSQN